MTPVFFNLIINASLSLWAGLLVASFCLWAFRIQTGAWKLFFLSLPFVKIVADLVRGIPADSILRVGLDPFSLPPRSQILTINAGASHWGPYFNALFSVRDLTGREFGASLADYLHLWLAQNVGDFFPAAILLFFFAISMTLLTKRIAHAFRFERERRADRVFAKSFERISVPGRSVDVYVSETFSGTPFTGGIFRPYICLPGDAVRSLQPSELRAVIEHELGHVKSFDLAATVVIQILGDLFWFIPGYRFLSRKIDRVREILADQTAVEAGVHPAHLASALIKLKEIPTIETEPILYSAFFRERSLLKTRVLRLVSPSEAEAKSRLGWNYFWLRFIIGFWISVAILFSTIGGNNFMAGAQPSHRTYSFIQLYKGIC